MPLAFPHFNAAAPNLLCCQQNTLFASTGTAAGLNDNPGNFDNGTKHNSSNLAVAGPSTVVMTGLTAVGVGVGTTILDCTTVGAATAAGVTPASLWGISDDRSSRSVVSVPKAARKASSSSLARLILVSPAPTSLRLASVIGIFRASIVAAKYLSSNPLKQVSESEIAAEWACPRVQKVPPQKVCYNVRKIQTSGSPVWRVDGSAAEAEIRRWRQFEIW